MDKHNSGHTDVQSRQMVARTGRKLADRKLADRGKELSHGGLQQQLQLTHINCYHITEVEVTGRHQSISVHIAQMTAHNSSGVDTVSRHILLQ